MANTGEIKRFASRIIMQCKYHEKMMALLNDDRTLTTALEFEKSGETLNELLDALKRLDGLVFSQRDAECYLGVVIWDKPL